MIGPSSWPARTSAAMAGGNGRRAPLASPTRPWRSTMAAQPVRNMPSGVSVTEPSRPTPRSASAISRARSARSRAPSAPSRSLIGMALTPDSTATGR